VYYWYRVRCVGGFGAAAAAVATWGRADVRVAGEEGCHTHHVTGTGRAADGESGGHTWQQASTHAAAALGQGVLIVFRVGEDAGVVAAAVPVRMWGVHVDTTSENGREAPFESAVALCATHYCSTT